MEHDPDRRADYRARARATRLPAVLREWREPRHPEFREGRTAWRLFNAFTEALKGIGSAFTPRGDVAGDAQRDA